MGDPVAKTFRIYIALPDDTPLRIGMSLEANVVTREKQNALLVPADELARRARENPVAEVTAPRGYHKLFLQTVLQADRGADFDFLRAPETIGKTPER